MNKGTQVAEGILFTKMAPWDLADLVGWPPSPPQRADLARIIINACAGSLPADAAPAIISSTKPYRTPVGG